MKRLSILAISLLWTLAAGCAQVSDPPRVVTGVLIQVENTAEPGEILYTDPKKMTMALNYLRCLSLWDPPAENPEALPGPRYWITLRFSDGGFRTYEQIGTACIRSENGSWMVLPPERALRLPLLLAIVPTDSI